MMGESGVSRPNFNIAIPKSLAENRRVKRDSNPIDSDREEIEKSSHQKQLQEARSGKQVSRTRRRFIIEPGNDQKEIILAAELKAGEREGIYISIRNPQDFLDSATDDPDAWCDVIRTMTASIIAHKEQTSIAMEDLMAEKASTIDLRYKLKESERQHSQNQDDVIRLREARTTYRTRYENLVEENAQLNTEIQSLKDQLLNAAPPGDDFDNSDPNDSDRDNGPLRRRPDSHRRATALSGSRFTTPITGATNSGIRKSNNKYPDVKDFFGNDTDRYL